MLPPSLARVGRYELIRLIGSGGMGEVYEAVLNGPSGFRKRVALKRVLGTRLSDPRNLAREARLGALLSHPNVVATWELSETEEGWIVAMELVNGPSLTQLRLAGPLSPVAVADVGAQVAAALSYIHESRIEGQSVGIVHRDVKPSNLLVDPSGLVKLADLGIAAPFSPSETNGPAAGAAGTAGLAAPEQISGHAEPRSDVFSLGVVLVWLVTGTYPFGVGTAALLGVQHPERILRRTRVLDAVEAHVPGLGPIVARCLRADPGLRWATARELGDALRELRSRCPRGDGLAELVEQRFPPRAAPVESQPFTGTPTYNTAPTNVPTPGATLIGRASELEALGRALADVRVVGVRGPPGIGKSRLVAEIAQHRAGWWVDLDDVRSVAGLCSAVGLALGVPLMHGDPVDRLGAALSASGAGLLVLDAADRVDDLERVVRDWRIQAPDLRMAVIGRARIPFADRELVLEPLAYPEALALLEARAGDSLGEIDPDDVRSLLAALDGVPLAIELAARLPVGRLASLEVRAGRVGGALQAAFESAWDALGPVERAALCRLTTFAGGWDLDAAQAVLCLDDDGWWAVDVLQRLADRSLVQIDPVSGRYRLLGPVRALASERLDPEIRTRVEHRHGDFYGRLSIRADPLRIVPDQGDEIRRLVLERENLVVATRRAVARRDAALAGACVMAVVAGLLATGPLPLARALLDEVLALSSLPQEAEVRTVAAVVADEQGDHPAASEHLARARDTAGGKPGVEVALDLALGNHLDAIGHRAGALVCLERARAGAEALGHERLLARTLSDLAKIHRPAGRVAEAEAHLLCAIELYRKVRNRRGEAVSLNNLANLRNQLGRRAESRALYHESLRLADLLGDEVLSASAYGNLALHESRYGQPRAAVAYLQRALRIHRQSGSVPPQILWLGHLGSAWLQHGDLGAARSALESGVALARTHLLVSLGTIALAGLGELELLAGRLDLAWDHVAAALADEEHDGDERATMEMRCRLAPIARARGDLDRAWSEADSAVRWADAHGNAPFGADARLERGLVSLDRGDRASAEADLVCALPELGVLDVLRARAALALVRPTEDEELDAIEAEVASLGLLPDAPLVRFLTEVRAQREA